MHRGKTSPSMWGISPQTNLVSGIGPTSSDDAINILLLCPSDPRSIIATIAEARVKNSVSEIHFYVLEESLEALARHFLLLHVFFDECIPIRKRAALYLEIFGNTLVQEKTAGYVEENGKLLEDLVLDGKEPSGTEGMFDLSLLKQRELDGLADIFASWKRSNKGGISLKETRDEVLRQFYGDRYDCRDGVIDWDYQMNVKPYASIIHRLQFRDWRLKGIAFEFGGAVYDSDNRSLATPKQGSVRHTDNNTMQNMDVVTGPFISLGITCDRTDPLADGLFYIHNQGTGAEQHRYSAADVALYNVTSFMWQATTGTRYEMKVKGDTQSGLGAGENQESVSSQASEGQVEDQIACEKVKISIIPVRDSRKIFNRKFKFDTAFVSHSTSSILQDDKLYSILKEDATLVVETSRYDLTKSIASHKEARIQIIKDILSSRNAVEVVDGSDTFADSVLTYKLHT